MRHGAIGAPSTGRYRGKHKRLSGLKKAIIQRQTIPLEDLFAKSRIAFYGGNVGRHYAMARYDLLWYGPMIRGHCEEFEMNLL